jgi:hypothetical protein
MVGMRCSERQSEHTVLRKEERPVTTGRSSQFTLLPGNSPAGQCYDVVGAGCKWRYMMYALIDPVLANSFQKISEVRICRRYPFVQRFERKMFGRYRGGS